MTLQKEEVPKVSAGGLVTVAFLKARLDEGSDHLGIFMPLVLDVVSQLSGSNFATAEVQGTMAAIHRVSMPQTTVETLLKRAVRKGYLIRESGRYRRNPDRTLPQSRVADEKAQVEVGLLKLGTALQSHAASHQLSIATPDLALDMLFQFLEKEQVALLLGNLTGDNEAAGSGRRERIIIAGFIQDSLRGDPTLAKVLRGVLEGLVLYHAAFLPEMATISHGFNDLLVAFDTVLVRQALGYEGQAMYALMQETIRLLKASGVRCVVFDKSLHEIQRILNMYESKLATAKGRDSLRPVPMARHFLTQQYKPSDVREMSALLERDVVSAGLHIQKTPEHVEELTLGEEALAKRLSDRVKKDELEPRVMHDVDCIAGVLTLRKGHRSSTIENARVVFATASPMVIRNTRLWWEEDEREGGFAPIVHIRVLASLAWLKKPSACADYKVRELVSLCAAALRPTTETWRRFLQHLETLKSSQRLTSDEAASIVVSRMSDQLLTEAEMSEEDPNDIDATTLDEIVDRVKATYGAKSEQIAKEYERKLSEADERARVARLQAEAKENSVAERIRQHELLTGGRAKKLASIITKSFQWVVASLLIIGAIVLIVGHPFHGGLAGTLLGICVVTFVVLELLGVLSHLNRCRVTIELRLEKRLHSWLIGEEKVEQNPNTDRAAK